MDEPPSFFPPFPLDLPLLNGFSRLRRLDLESMKLLLLPSSEVERSLDPRKSDEVLRGRRVGRSSKELLMSEGIEVGFGIDYEVSCFGVIVGDDREKRKGLKIQRRRG